MLLNYINLSKIFFFLIYKLSDQMSLIILKYLHSKSLIYDALVHDDRKAKKKIGAKGLSLWSGSDFGVQDILILFEYGSQKWEIYK